MPLYEAFPDALAEVGTPYASEAECSGNDVSPRCSALIAGFINGFKNIIDGCFDTDPERIRRPGKAFAFDLTGMIHQRDVRFRAAAIDAHEELVRFAVIGSILPFCQPCERFFR